jgi:hypothetical protein
VPSAAWQRHGAAALAGRFAAGFAFVLAGVGLDAQHLGAAADAEAGIIEASSSPNFSPKRAKPLILLMATQKCSHNVY